MTKLPCGIEVDTNKDECCVTVCDKPEIGGQKDGKTGRRLNVPPRKERCLAVDACPHWAERRAQDLADDKLRSRIGH